MPFCPCSSFFPSPLQRAFCVRQQNPHLPLFPSPPASLLLLKHITLHRGRSCLCPLSHPLCVYFGRVSVITSTLQFRLNLRSAIQSCIGSGNGNSNSILGGQKLPQQQGLTMCDVGSSRELDWWMPCLMTLEADSVTLSE